MRGSRFELREIAYNLRLSELRSKMSILHKIDYQREAPCFNSTPRPTRVKEILLIDLFSLPLIPQPLTERSPT